MKLLRTNVGRGTRGANKRTREFTLALAVVLLAMMVAGCGGDDAASTTSSPGPVASDTTSTAAPTTLAPSTTLAPTTTSSVTTTTVKPTTTTAAPTTTTKKTTTTVKPTTTTAKGPIVLTLIGPAGTKELSMAELKALSATSGYGGWKNQLENITGPHSYKGVRITALMELVGGGSSAHVIASDGYEQTLSGGEIGGNTPMYDPATGQPVESINGSLRAILAYSKGGSAIGSGDGPLRIAFVSPEKEQVTDSVLWVKMVKTIKVN